MSARDFLQFLNDLRDTADPRHTPQQWEALLWDADQGHAHE